MSTRLPLWSLLLFLLITGALDAQPTSSSLAIPSDAHTIELLEGTLTPPPSMGSADRRLLTRQAAQLATAGRGQLHVLVQFHELPDATSKNELWRRDLDLGSYVSGQAWMASLPVEALDRVLALPEVRWMMPWTAEHKLHPRVKAGEWAPWTLDPDRPGWVMIFVQLHHDVNLETGTGLVEGVGGVAMPPVEGLHGLTAWVSEEGIRRLAREEDVLWIEEGPPPLSPTNDGTRANMRVDAVHGPAFGLEGAGVRLFVFDGGPPGTGSVRATHQTFDAGAGSRVTDIDATGDFDHPTHVAGTAAGDGDGGRPRGVAPQATVLSAGYEQFFGTMLFWDNAGDIQADYATARNGFAADLGTNSIGSNTASNGSPCVREGDYGVSSALIDGIVRGDNATVGSPVLMTWANGNERTGGLGGHGRCGSNYVTTAPPSCAKNPIHVGATNSDGGSMTHFSSWGPCDDGRLKPVISAPGCEVGRASGEGFIFSSLNASDSAYGGMCGTSMATPAVAGTVALMIEAWRNQGYGGANDRPLPALVKAQLVHTARDRGQVGPDYIYGYGEVDAESVVGLVRVGNPLGGASPAWGTGSVNTGQTDTFTVAVPAGSAELKATLAWDDAAAAAFAANAPVNDLTLEIVAPGGTIHRAWVLDPANPHLDATRGTNTRDNQEQVLVDNPAAGTWTVRVRGTAVPVGPQGYGLVYSVEANDHDPASCTEAVTNTGFETNTAGWTLSGAARVAAPAGGHGAFSLRLGGGINRTDEAFTEVTIPADIGRAELSYSWYMTTQEGGASGHTWDIFSAEVRDTAGNVLATFDLRSDGWRAGAWMQQANVDLTPWAGQTVRIAFRATNNSFRFTTFWIDDVHLDLCDGVAQLLILMDRTGSMEFSTVSDGDPATPDPTRCEHSVALAINDLNSFFALHPEATGSQAAVWSFSVPNGTVPIIQDLSGGFTGQAGALAALNSLVGVPCAGATNLADAICETADNLTSTFSSLAQAQRLFNLYTDGEENWSMNVDPLTLCEGPDTSTLSTPPYDLGSWHRNTREHLLGRVTSNTVLWVAPINPIPPLVAGEPATRLTVANAELTGEARRLQTRLGAVTDEEYFEELAAATGGVFRLVVDGQPLPPGLFPDPNLRGAFHNNGGDLVRVNTTTGVASPLTWQGSPFQANLNGVTAAARSGANFLYLATGDGDDALWRVNELAGTVTRVGAFGGGATNVQAMDFAPPEAAAWGFVPGSLYGISMDGLGGCNPHCLFRIDPTTGAATALAGLQLNQGRGMSFHPQTGELWVYDQGGKVLYTVRPNGQKTWKAYLQSSNFGQHTGVDTMYSLAHSCDGRLFGVDVAYGVLLRIDPATGQAFWVGPYGSIRTDGSFDLQGLDGSPEACSP